MMPFNSKCKKKGGRVSLSNNKRLVVDCKNDVYLLFLVVWYIKKWWHSHTSEKGQKCSEGVLSEVAFSENIRYGDVCLESVHNDCSDVKLLPE